MSDVCFDAVREVHADELTGVVQSIHERIAVGRAMGFEHATVEAKEWGAAVALGLDALSKAYKGVFGEEAAEATKGRGSDLRFELVTEKPGERFPTLEADIAGKTVADYNIDVIGEHLEALDGADVVHK